jgi:hypothetical protein
MLVGHPVIARVQSPTTTTYAPTGYTTFGQGGASTTLGYGPVTVVVLAPGSENLAIQTAVIPGANVAPTTRLGVVVDSPGGGPVTRPVRYGVDRLPIHVHWGLNRVVLTESGANPQGLTIQIQNMVLVRD